ncbi:hypothetical protein [Geoglobus acetivorans]|uniref:Uncharacterized protein n=1 Tax=Geoglobus acetivorans TaxID=565033 RepID=A0ABZ3H394_GEOAI|nr:hypothetical protein [Geoglobus acetivorans]
MDILGIIGKVLKYVSFAMVLYLVTAVFYHYYSGLAYLPDDYYGVAESMYSDPGVHDIWNLSMVLNSTVLPVCNTRDADGSEASAYLEWYLEGHGFKTYIARSDAMNKMWVIVELDDGSRVAVEPMFLCSGDYNPPGIIDSPDGKFRNFSVTWEEYEKGDFDGTYSEFLKRYEYYYKPPKIFENPGQAMGIASSIRYPGWKKLSSDEIDWWNSEPFSTMEPFSSWS